LVPLTLNHLRALDLMWDHLTKGASLPESQVLHTTPRAGEAGRAPPLQSSDVPPIPLMPRPVDHISVENGHVSIPE
jgi:hydroxybutyrate-dimer hydrolase